jgi:GAF domain-containing protein
MADNDLTNQLEDMFSEITSESETEETEDVPLLREIVADLLEGEVVTEPGTAEPAIAEVRADAFAQTQPVAEEQGNASILEEAVAGLFENDPDTTYDVVEPVVARVPTGVMAKLEEEKGEEEVPQARVSSLGVAPTEARIKSLKAVSYILFVFLGLLFVFLLIGLIGPILVAGPVFAALYLTGCVLALASAVMLWKRNLSLADEVREAEEERVEALDSRMQLAERVSELNTVNSALQKRALQFESANQVLNALSPTLEPDQLVQEAVNQVRDRFDLYYVGLFLIDESGQSAALRACTLAGWQDQTGGFDHEMLSQGYKLEVGGASMVGRCTAKGQALIVLDLDEEAYHHDYTLLPGAHSEMALPLQSGGRVLGALDLQSIQRQAFSREDSDIFQTLADQLVTAIENAQTFVELEARLEALSPGEFQPGYVRGQQPGFTLGPAGSLYERTQSGVTPLGDKAPPEVEQAVTQRDLIVQAETGDGEGRSALVAPITLRGEVIGALGFHEEDSRQWTDEETALIEDVATQVSLAVENVRLFDQTQTALDETDALYRASRAIASADSVEGILHAIVGSLTSPRIDQCFLGIFDSPGGKLSDGLVIVSSWSQEVEPLWQVGTQLSLNRDLIGERVGRDQPLILSDVAAETGLDEIKWDELMTAGIRSLAVVPLVAAGGWIGVLTLAAARTGVITERNVQPYLTLAGQAALSIERSSLFKQTQEALEETSMLYRASRAIGAATSIPEVANVLLSSVDEGGFERGLVLIRRQVDDELEVVAGWDRSSHPVEVGAQMDINQVSPNLREKEPRWPRFPSSSVDHRWASYSLRAATRIS